MKKRTRHKPRASVYQNQKLFIIIMNTTTIAAVAALCRHYPSTTTPRYCITA